MTASQYTASHFVLSMALQWEASFSDFLGSEVPKISLTGRCNTCGGGESSPIRILFARHFLNSFCFLSLRNSFCKWLPPSRLLPLILTPTLSQCCRFIFFKIPWKLVGKPQIFPQIFSLHVNSPKIPQLLIHTYMKALHTT